MKTKIFIVMAALALPLMYSSKTDDALKKLSDLGITLEQIENSSEGAHANYTFKKSEKTVVEADKSEDGPKESSKVSEYDPRRADGAKWKLVNVDGGEPSEKDIKSFNKSANGEKKEGVAKIDPASLKVVSETDDQLIIGFKYLATSLTKESKFLEACEAEYTINKTTKRLVSGKVTNFQPTKMSIMKVSKLTLTVDLKYLEASNTYHSTKERLVLKASLLGIDVKSESDIKYENFEKVL